MGLEWVCMIVGGWGGFTFGWIAGGAPDVCEAEATTAAAGSGFECGGGTSPSTGAAVGSNTQAGGASGMCDGAVD